MIRQKNEINNIRMIIINRIDKQQSEEDTMIGGNKDIHNMRTIITG
jgi:hypothetical protein